LPRRSFELAEEMARGQTTLCRKVSHRGCPARLVNSIGNQLQLKPGKTCRVAFVLPTGPAKITLQFNDRLHPNCLNQHLAAKVWPDHLSSYAPKCIVKHRAAHIERRIEHIWRQHLFFLVQARPVEPAAN